MFKVCLVVSSLHTKARNGHAQQDIASMCLGTVRRRIAEHFIALYETRVKPILPSLRKSVIHSDFNDYNICISDDEQQVTGFFDFGDMVHSSTINDIAIAAAYALLGPGEWLAVCVRVCVCVSACRALGFFWCGGVTALNDIHTVDIVVVVVARVVFVEDRVCLAAMLLFRCPILRCNLF